MHTSGNVNAYHTPLQCLIGKDNQLILMRLVADKVDCFMHIADIDSAPQRADIHNQVGEMLILTLSQHLLLSNVINTE